MANETVDKIGNLEDEALKRKERLKALKRGELKNIEATDGAESVNMLDLFPKPIFRNYTPKDEILKPGVLPKPNLIEIENEIKDQLANSKPMPLIENEIDLTTLAPQKIDWDLKRDVEKKLRLLEKRTQKAIVELIKERINKQKNADLAELVSLGTREDTKKDSKQEDDDSEPEENEEEDNDLPSSPFELNDKREISDDDDY